MMKHRIIQISLFVMVMLSFKSVNSQTITVDNLEDLVSYFAQDNVDVKMEPGLYTLHTGLVNSGILSNPLLSVTGSNSTYDFTGVTFFIQTSLLQKFGSVSVTELQILGNENVLKNLTMIDILNQKPKKSAVGIVMDGRDNRIEGFHCTVEGSYPYGFGDAFGKGGANTVISHQKHSGILIRGLRNHLKSTTLISRSYGHCVFMQAASFPTIEDCYIEGETRTTDDMLAGLNDPDPSSGAQAAAEAVDFMTTWGYRLPPGYTMSLQEAGIRAYNAGTTYIDGVEIERGTDNPTILNCTVKNTRTGVILAHATGTSYVEGCKVYGVETGYSVGGTGTIVNSSADAVHGLVYKNAYGTDRGYVADIIISAPSTDYYNGHEAVAYVGGYNHNLTFRSEETEFPSDLKIMMGGDLQGLRVLHGSNPSQNNHVTHDVVLNNLSNFPVVLDSKSYNNTVNSCDVSLVSDSGTNNTILELSNCSLSDSRPLDFLSEMKLYPNPVEDELRISFENTNLDLASAVVVLYNMNGQSVRSLNSIDTKHVNLDLSGLESGVYILRVSDSSNSITTKIVKK